LSSSGELRSRKCGLGRPNRRWKYGGSLLSWKKFCPSPWHLDLIAKMLHLIQRCTIMKKFRRFLGGISAETYLKWIVLVINPPKSQSAGVSVHRPPFRLND